MFSKSKNFNFQKIIIIFLSCHQHRYPGPLSPPFPIRSSGLHSASSQSYCMSVRAGRLAFVWPCEGVHRITSLMSSFLLLQRCPCMSGSSNYNSFRDGLLVAVRLLLCGVLHPGIIQYCLQQKAVNPLTHTHSLSLSLSLFHTHTH